MFYLKIFFLLFFTFFIVDAKDEYKNYFCSGKIYISDPRFNVNEISQICDKISSDYRILINVQEKLNIDAGGSELDNYYTRDSEEFFNRQCNKLKRSICEYGFLISIYTKARKVRITSGSVSKYQVTYEMRNNIINSIRKLLSQNMFLDSII